MSELGTGKRFNTGKTQLALVPSRAQEKMAEVFTVGAAKYGSRNWEFGMSWTTVLNSLKRHLTAFENGEDFDPETGLLHMDHAACNVAMLSTYYETFPQGDDRFVVQIPKIGIDVDDVLADFVGGYAEATGNTAEPVDWNYTYPKKDYFEGIKSVEKFFLGLKKKDTPNFPVTAYITARRVPTEVTQQWIVENNLPCMPIITVGENKSKLQVCKDLEIEVFVDDKYETFLELNQAGICCYLYTAPHNVKYEVGHKRINSLSDLPWSTKTK